ncbi:hypothetical protein F4604DRAFT_1920163 [Suillus subluteus]|nr:hypothetical protein F4604DRAFT_1920163 [Suillus subluteus]
MAGCGCKKKMPDAQHENASQAKEARKTNKYAQQALRSQQALEELNGFHCLDPESEEQDSESDLEFDQDVFMFKPVPPSVTCNSAVTQTSQMPPRLTQQASNIPSVPVRQMPPSDNVIDPALLEDHAPQHHTYNFAQPPATPQLHQEPDACITPREQDSVAQDSCRGIMRLAYNAWPGEYGQPASSPLEEYGRPESLAMLNYSGVQHPHVSALTPSQQVPLPLASVGMKHAGHPALATTEALQFAKMVKMGEGRTCGHIHSADLNKLYSTTVHLAVSHYQSILVDLTIYPNDIQAREWSGQAWAAACCSQWVCIDYDEDVYKLITECDSNLCSNLKTVLLALVETEFGFTNEKTPEAIKSNAALAATLLRNHKLLTCNANIILKGMIKWSYDRKNSMGATLASYFKDCTTGGASLGIIAVVLTGIEACVVEWTTSTRIETCFYKEHYAAVFESYHKMLVDFDKGMKHADILPKICERLLRHARRHANVPEDPVRVGGTSNNFSTDEFAAAAAEWDGCVELDDEN